MSNSTKNTNPNKPIKHRANKSKAKKPYLERMIEHWFGERRRDTTDWVSDADWARIEQRPVRAKALLHSMILAVIALLIWASYAELDEIARGEGRVVSASQLQIIQSVDGGVVEEILVHEGQIVDAGDVLMRIDPTRFISTFRENHARYLALLVRAERLEALTSERPFQPPADLIEEASGVVEHERKLYLSIMAEVESQQSIARDQMEQRTQELNESLARLNQASRAYELGSRELHLTRPLLAAGAISEVEVIRLEREVSRAQGEREQATAQISRLRSAITEAERRIHEIKLTSDNRLRSELSNTLAELASLTEGSIGLRDRIRHAEIRASVRSTVQRLIVTTRGAVVQPGREVLELVPLDDQLLVETRISPRDIAFIRPKQPAVVKLTAYDFSIFGGLDGEVEHISADALTDEQGNSFYLVRVRTDATSFAEDKPVIPGMIAQVDILTGKKTLLEYILKPILRAKANAFTER